MTTVDGNESVGGAPVNRSKDDDAPLPGCGCVWCRAATAETKCAALAARVAALEAALRRFVDMSDRTDMAWCDFPERRAETYAASIEAARAALKEQQP